MSSKFELDFKKINLYYFHKGRFIIFFVAFGNISRYVITKLKTRLNKYNGKVKIFIF